jgi:hypothetical protein
LEQETKRRATEGPATVSTMSTLDPSQMADDLGTYDIMVTRITKNSTPTELRASINILTEHRKTNCNPNLKPKLIKAIQEYRRQLKLRTVISEIPQRDPIRQARAFEIYKARLLKKSKMKNRFLPKEKSEKLDTKQKETVVRSREQRTKKEAQAVTEGLASKRERRIPKRFKPVDVEKTSSSMTLTTTTKMTSNKQSKKKRKFSEVDYEPLLPMPRTMRFVVGQKVEVRGIGAHYNKTWFRAEVTAIYGGTLHCPVSYDFVYKKTSEGNWKHEIEKKVTHNSDKMRPWRGHAHTLRSETVDENKNDLCEETPGMSLSAFFNYSY